MKRFNLPPLSLIQGFEAAARTLSFTKAAEELFITQSAVSRQMRALEESLGVPLFERRPRALLLTQPGRQLQRAVEDILATLQEACDQVRVEGSTRHLTVTTTSGFASLWLIPRLRGFTQLHPDVDVRIQATYKPIPLERSLVDVAVRYCQEDKAPPDGVRLFGEELMPVCAPSLVREAARPLRELRDLEAHTLLHMESAEGFLDWGTWLAAEGLIDLKSAASLRFDSYEQMIQAALSGQGVALGIRRLVHDLMEGGQLVAPFGRSVVSRRAYYVIRSKAARKQPHVDAFVAWIEAEAKACKPSARTPAIVNSRSPAARSNGAGRRARSVR